MDSNILFGTNIVHYPHVEEDTGLPNLISKMSINWSQNVTFGIYLSHDKNTNTVEGQYSFLVNRILIYL